MIETISTVKWVPLLLECYLYEDYDGQRKKPTERYVNTQAASQSGL